MLASAVAITVAAVPGSDCRAVGVQDAEQFARTYDSDWVHVFTICHGKVSNCQEYHVPRGSEL
jgi:hypothetical protein